MNQRLQQRGIPFPQMLPEIPDHPPVLVPFHKEWAPLAADSLGVKYNRIRTGKDGETLPPHLGAKIQILAMKKVSLVKSTHRLEDLAADHQAGTRDRIGFQKLIIHNRCLGVKIPPAKNPPQPRRPHHCPPGIGLLPTPSPLHPAVIPKQPATGNGGSRMLRQGLFQPLHQCRRCDAIGIQKKQQLSIRRLGSNIATRRKSDVPRQPDHLESRTLREHFNNRSQSHRLRRIVHQHHFRGLTRHRGNAIGQRVPCIVIHDDDRCFQKLKK